MFSNAIRSRYMRGKRGADAIAAEISRRKHDCLVSIGNRGLWTNELTVVRKSITIANRFDSMWKLGRGLRRVICCLSLNW